MIVSKRVTLAALIAAVWLVFGSAAPSAALAAGARIVDNDYPSPTACKGAGYATIQAAIASIGPGQSGTITVCAGIYTENASVTDKGKVKLIGKPGAIIRATSATQLILATNTTQLTVQGFMLDGAGFAVGGMIDIHDGSALITKNVFLNSSVGSGVRTTIAGGAHTLTVTNNQFTSVGFPIYGASSGGKITAKVTGNIVTSGLSGITIGALAGGSAAATVTGNQLHGPAGATGIQVSAVAKLKVSGNTIQGFVFGIFMSDSSHATVSQNKVRSADYGIYLTNNAADTSSNKIVGNIFEAAWDNFTGVYISTSGALASDSNQVIGNTITDPGSAYNSTIGVKLVNAAGSLDKTVIKGNKLVNIDTFVDPTGDTHTVISGNKCTPGVCVI